MADTGGEEGKYLYCVAATGQRDILGPIGLDGREVYTIPYQSICAVVHDCQAGPYGSDNPAVIEQWVSAHQAVVDSAWKRWGTVLPSGFSTILKGRSGGDSAEPVAWWLKRDYDRLKARLDCVQEKAEYGVQVFWDPKAIAKDIAALSPEISAVEECLLRLQSRGLGYMYRQKLENLLKLELEARADQYFKECYGRIKKHVAEIRVEKVKKGEAGLQMILNLSCLVPQDGYSGLAEELDKINRLEVLCVRFTGPWPPYSFAG